MRGRGELRGRGGSGAPYRLSTANKVGHRAYVRLLGLRCGAALPAHHRCGFLDVYLPERTTNA